MPMKNVDETKETKIGFPSVGKKNVQTIRAIISLYMYTIAIVSWFHEMSIVVFLIPMKYLGK